MNLIRLVSLLFIALLSAATAAQTGLRLYENIEASWVNSTGLGTSHDRRSSFGEGIWTPSEWGVSGNEDLGSGVTAQMNLEGGFYAAYGSMANDGMPGDIGTNRFAFGNLGYSLYDINLLPAIYDHTQQYQQYLRGKSVSLGAAKFAGSYVYFRTETGNSTNTYIIGTGLQVMSKKIGR